jgi:hypothetical protein
MSGHARRGRQEMNFLNQQLVQTRGDTVLDVRTGRVSIIENYYRTRLRGI